MEPEVGYKFSEIQQKYLVSFDDEKTRARILFSQDMEDCKSLLNTERSQTEFHMIRKGEFGFSIGSHHASDASGVAGFRGPMQKALFQRITQPHIYFPKGSFEVNRYIQMGNQYEPHQSEIFSRLNPDTNLSCGCIIKINNPKIAGEDHKWEFRHSSPDAIVWKTKPRRESSWDPKSMNHFLEELTKPERAAVKSEFESFLDPFEDILYPVEYKIACTRPRTSIPPEHLTQCIMEAYCTKSTRARYLSSYVENGKLLQILHLEIHPQEQLITAINSKLDQFSQALFSFTCPESQTDESLLRELFDMTTIMELHQGTPNELGLSENILSELDSMGIPPLLIR